MSKKETFENIVGYSIRKSLREVYNIPTPYLTASQDILVRSISEKMFYLFGDFITVKELQEKVGEKNETANTLQKD